MKKLILISILLVSVFVTSKAQSPQSFQYQAVVRDAAGNAVVSQPVNFQISIISGSITGTVEYVENHNASTNAFGVVTLGIGSGTPVMGTFSGILWGNASHFIKVEADHTGGTSYLDMGTTQLLSVPYSLYSEKAGNIPTYTGGAGIDVTGTTITNTSPDQPVTLTQGGATSITGTYPNFTISSTDNNTTYTAGTGINVSGTIITNTAPDQNVTLSQGGATTVTGTYPNFTISSSDNNTTYSAGSGLTLTGTTFSNSSPDQVISLTQAGATTVTGSYPNFTISSTDLNSGTPGGLNKTIQFNNSGVFAGDTSMIWDNTNKRLGVGLTNPNGRMVIRGNATAPDTEPLFEVKNKAGQTVFIVYPDSVHIYVKDGGAKSNKGGFAVSGRNSSKAFTNNFLSVTPDSTRIFTGDTVSGFGVQNLGGGSSTSYLHLTPSNYFIGHQAGDAITSGLYNSFIGYHSGGNDTSGSSNVFLGYQSGFSNTSGTSNIGIGFQSLYSNTNGMHSVGIGHLSGYSNIGPGYITAVGYSSLFHNTTGNQNTAIGYYTSFNNTTGNNNAAFGSFALASNTTGAANTAIGTDAMEYNSQANFNTSLGYESLFFNSLGNYNAVVGFQTGFGTYGVNYNQCTLLGSTSSLTVDRTNVTMLGFGIANAQCTGNNQVLLGNTAVTQIRATVTGITSYSDARYKTNVSENVSGLDFILKLKPVTYTVRPTELHKIWASPDSSVSKIDHREIEQNRFIGFMAQDVEKAAKECGFDFPGIDIPKNDKEVYSLRYVDFIMPLVKGMQDQQIIIENLNNKINDFQKQIDELKSIINK